METLVAVCILPSQQLIVIFCAVVQLVVEHLNILDAFPFEFTSAIVPLSGVKDWHCHPLATTGGRVIAALTELQV